MELDRSLSWCKSYARDSQSAQEACDSFDGLKEETCDSSASDDKVDCIYRLRQRMRSC